MPKCTFHPGGDSAPFYYWNIWSSPDYGATLFTTFYPINPWRLLADASGYIFTWLLGYSGGLGSIAGVLIADYWIVRRRELQLEDLYLADGFYRGWNWRAIGPTPRSRRPCGNWRSASRRIR